MMQRSIAIVGALALLGLLLSMPLASYAAEGEAGSAGVPAGGPVGLIVIDPGHGGKDSGAIGPGGTKEKDLTLDISKKLEAKLAGMTGADIVLTRGSDEYLSLKERTEFANTLKADVFISIHINAAKRKNARGVETFFLSFEASDDEARKTAAFENEVISLGGDIAPIPRDDIEAILWDLTQTEAHAESSKLAEFIYERLFKATDGGENRGVKQAPFYVLVGATMPAVLLEVGFISNPGEEARLTSAEEQTKIVEAIASGITDFEKAMIKRVGLIEKEVTEGERGTTEDEREVTEDERGAIEGEK